MIKIDEIDDEVSVKNLNMKMDVKKGHLFIIILILFLIGGFSIGYVVGSSVSHNQWQRYFNIYEERIEDFCICSYSSIDEKPSEVLTWE